MQLQALPKVFHFIYNHLKKWKLTGITSLPSETILKIINNASLLIALSYLAANMLSTVVLTQIISAHLKNLSRVAPEVADNVILNLNPQLNFRDAMKIIKERNIFNAEGKFPEEKFEKGKKIATGQFNINAPCQKSTLAIELLGTLYAVPASRSVAIVKDKNYSEADIYKIGDSIVGADNAMLAAIERQKIVINNAGVKECIDLNQPINNGKGDQDFPTVAMDGRTISSGGGGGGSEITLESSYVESELGAGFAKIVDAARLVPNTLPDGSMNGFKIFAIKPDSILSRVGLQNNDVIIQVNDTSLKLPEQGFSFYQSFQSDKDIRIQLLRNGNTPTTINVHIK